jgi:hypothetical protein
VGRQQPMKGRNQDMTQLNAVCDWLFPVHGGFSFTGRDVKYLIS